MRIKYPPLLDLETVLTGSHLEGRLLVVDVKIGKKDAALVLSEDEARNLKKALEDGIFKLSLKHG